VKIAEIVLHGVGLEAQAEHKTAEAVFGVNLHYVPENRVFADGHHGFGAEFGFFFNARTQAPAQDEDGNVHSVHQPMLTKYEVQRKSEFCGKEWGETRTIGP
jgi:hypothetical protein